MNDGLDSQDNQQPKSDLPMTTASPALASPLAEKTLWAEAVAFTREKSPGSFDQWFSGVQFDGLTEGVLGLRARDEFVREWVDEHFLPTLTDHLRSKTGLSIQVAWTIDGVLDAPVSARPSDLQNERKAAAASAVEASMPSNDLPTAGGVRPKPMAIGEGSIQASDRERRARLEAVAAPLEGLNPKYTFSNFVIGPSNQLAHAASVAAAGGGGKRHNPLFLCGGTGLGKTHLVHAVAHRVRAQRPSAKILYISAEKFINEFVQALQDQKMNEFRTRYREKCDLLLVDDIQFLASKTQTQEEFFHAFNALHQADKQIIVTSDKYPQQLERMEERLVSRFTWGLVADIQAPELETRVAIVRKKAQMEGIEVGDDVLLYIAQQVRSNVRELEGTLIRLAAKASLTSRPIDLDFARQEIAMSVGIRVNESSVEDVQRVVCHHFKLKSSDLLSKDRHKSIAFARHVAMYLCRERLKCSLPELGRAFGNRDHTTVMSAVRKVKTLRESNPEVRAHLEALERKLGAAD
ncbi:MAG TPA: chromosomal replication initiator protein DnaA [Polyangiaceae bacterium]